MSLKIKRFNANPWGKFLPDCSVRALSYGLNRSYKNICKMFNAPCKDDYGLELPDGLAEATEIISVCDKKGLSEADDIDNIYDQIFTGELEVIDDVDGGWLDNKDALIDIEMGDTLDEFAEMYPAGKYIVFIRPSRKTRLQGDKDWHATYLDNYKKTIVDTFDCRKGMYVFGWIKIRESAILKDSNPNSRIHQLKEMFVDNGVVTPQEFKTNFDTICGII